MARTICDSVDVYHANIINVGLGIREDNADLRSSVDYANGKGVPVIAAVGNDGASGKAYYYPAAYDAVFAVGSCNKAGEKSGFSQPGADVLAPGEGFTLASRNGVAYGVKGNGYRHFRRLSAQRNGINTQKNGAVKKDQIKKTANLSEKDRKAVFFCDIIELQKQK